MCLTSSSTGLTTGKEDENEKPKHVYVAVTDQMAKAQLGDSSNGRRDCLPVPFSQTRSMGWEEVISSYLGLVFLTEKDCHVDRLRIIMVFSTHLLKAF